MQGTPCAKVCTPSPRGGLGVGVALFIILLLASCGPQKGRVRIRGQFENLPQADLLLYSPDGGLSTIDTLHILRGRFDYQTKVEGDDPYTFVILYPNFSTLAFQAHSGCDVRIKGDALSLSQVSVEGADSVLPSGRQVAPRPLKVGSRLPRSGIVKHQRGTYLLMTFWADWKHGSNIVNYNTRTALNEHPDLRAFSYSLDLEPRNTRFAESIPDSMRWRTYCDYTGWGGPLLTRLGIRNIPYYILVGPDGKVLAMGSDYNQSIKPAMQKIP